MQTNSRHPPQLLGLWPHSRFVTGKFWAYSMYTDVLKVLGERIGRVLLTFCLDKQDIFLVAHKLHLDPQVARLAHRCIVGCNQKCRAQFPAIGNFSTCDAASALAIEAWRRQAGAPACSQFLQRLNGVCKLLHLRRPGVAAPSRKCCDPGRARESESLETTLSLPTVNSRYLYMRSYS